MSMTMQQRQCTETQNKIALLRRDIDQIKYKVQQRITEGEHLAGNKFDFGSLIKRYEQIASNVGEHSAFEQEFLEDEFMAAMESDPSQAELMCVCQRLNQLMITLKCKKDDLDQCQKDYSSLELGIPIAR